MSDEDKDIIGKEEENKVDENQPQEESTSINAQEATDNEPAQDNLETKEDIQSESESQVEAKKDHELIHKKDGRLHTHVR